MFMLRCIFWLAVMFACLPAGVGAIGAWRTARTPVVTGAADALIGQARGWCAAQPGDCASDAVRLSGLVATAMAETDDAPLPSASGPSRSHARHRAARTVLTGER